MSLNLGEFIEKEVKYAEADGFASLASLISNNASQISTAVGSEAPTEIAALIGLLEKGSLGLGPVAGGILYSGLVAAESAIDSELSPLIEQGMAYVPAVVTSLNNLAAKLRTEASSVGEAAPREAPASEAVKDEPASTMASTAEVAPEPAPEAVEPDIKAEETEGS